jgi:uncharacterized protein (UPF0276 family)
MEIDAANLAQNMSLPRFSDHLAWCVVTWFLAGDVAPQPIKGSNDRLASHIRTETNVLDQGRQETPAPSLTC